MSSVVFITGTSTGFGRKAAERFARRGDHVFATMRETRGRNAAHRQALEDLARTERLRLDVLDVDVTDDASVETGVRQALDRAGRIDVAINNAGVASMGITEAYTAEQFERLFQVNVFGVVRVNRAVLPAMRRQRSGLLIHVSSGAGRCTAPAMAPYCSSKFALESIADAYRFELKPFGIDSVLVEPGVYRTPIFDHYVRPSDTDRIAEYGANGTFPDRVLGVFMGVLSEPETGEGDEVAETFLQLADTPFGQRPFRTVLTPAMRQLLDGYNAMADALRPAVAGFFNTPELADGPPPGAEQ